MAAITPAVIPKREVRNSVREADVQIYAIGILRAGRRGAGLRKRSTVRTCCSELAEQTGGRDFEVDNIGEMPDVAAKIGLELRNQYVIGYSPKNKDRDGKFRRIQVKLVKTHGLGQITPRWRLGVLCADSVALRRRGDGCASGWLRRCFCWWLRRRGFRLRIRRPSLNLTSPSKTKAMSRWLCFAPERSWWTCPSACWTRTGS